jgi:catechol 2,3-dioxygenase-like lactoylglutathione lyase family enzyme
MDINLQFHHVSIRTNEFDKMVKFYEALGLSKFIEWIEKSRRCCFLQRKGSFFLEIKEFENQISELGKFEHICFHVDDVDAFHDLAIKHGAKSIDPPHDSQLNCLPVPIPNYRSAFFIGPCGEPIEVINWYGFDI